MQRSTAQDWTQRLARLATTAVSDVLDECGYRQQSLSSAIRPIERGMRFAGTAVCVGGVSEHHVAPDAPAALPAYAIDACVTASSVLVIATRGHEEGAVVGGLMSLAFARRGCAGVVVDGGVRDADEIATLKLPTFCRYVTPINATKRWRVTSIDQPVSVAGQTSEVVGVAPGDYVIGDVDGVMVIPQAIIGDVVEWAERLTDIERTIVAGLNRGESRARLFADHPRFAHIRRLK